MHGRSGDFVHSLTLSHPAKQVSIGLCQVFVPTYNVSQALML